MKLVEGQFKEKCERNYATLLVASELSKLDREKIEQALERIEGSSEELVTEILNKVQFVNTPKNTKRYNAFLNRVLNFVKHLIEKKDYEKFIIHDVSFPISHPLKLDFDFLLFTHILLEKMDKSLAEKFLKEVAHHGAKKEINDVKKVLKKFTIITEKDFLSKNIDHDIYTWCVGEYEAKDPLGNV